MRFEAKICCGNSKREDTLKQFNYSRNLGAAEMIYLLTIYISIKDGESFFLQQLDVYNNIQEPYKTVMRKLTCGASTVVQQVRAWPGKAESLKKLRFESLLFQVQSYPLLSGEADMKLGHSDVVAGF